MFMSLHQQNKIMTCLIVVIIFNLGEVLAQTDSTMSNVVRDHIYPFHFNGSFNGEGWDKIKEHAEKHKYFLIGEDHGFAEVPLFTKELIRHVGYDLFVTEIDSVSASISKRLASQTKAQIDSFHTSNPSALSFYSAKEEFELLQELAKSNADIWGLDQVSLFSTGIVFRRLNEVCTSEEAKKLTAELAELSDELFIEATRTANYDTLFIFSSTQQVFDRLKRVLQKENPKAKNIFNDIENSWRIYNGIEGANYDTRLGEMKSKLLNYYLNCSSNGKKYKKVLYKFGAYHVGKSESVLGRHDVGNFISNIAEAEGASSYHIMVVGKKGKMNSFYLTEGMESMSYDISDKESPLHALLPLADLVGKKWVYIDLKPLKKSMRKGKLIIGNHFLEKTIDGYDGIVIIPETTASRAY